MSPCDSRGNRLTCAGASVNVEWYSVLMSLKLPLAVILQRYGSAAPARQVENLPRTEAAKPPTTYLKLHQYHLIDKLMSFSLVRPGRKL